MLSLWQSEGVANLVQNEQFAVGHDGEINMFEVQYNEEMEQEVLRLEALQRAVAAGHPEWLNACAVCHCQLTGIDITRCEMCR
jgi:hypothetical protein